MKPTKNMQSSYTYRCSKCGIILPLNENGIPTTSIWFNGNYVCWHCHTGKPHYRDVADGSTTNESEVSHEEQ